MFHFFSFWKNQAVPFKFPAQMGILTIAYEFFSYFFLPAPPSPQPRTILRVRDLLIANYSDQLKRARSMCETHKEACIKPDAKYTSVVPLYSGNSREFLNYRKTLTWLFPGSCEILLHKTRENRLNTESLILGSEKTLQLIQFWSGQGYSTPQDFKIRPTPSSSTHASDLTLADQQFISAALSPTLT